MEIEPHNERKQRARPWNRSKNMILPIACGKPANFQPQAKAGSWLVLIGVEFQPYIECTVDAAPSINSTIQHINWLPFITFSNPAIQALQIT